MKLIKKGNNYFMFCPFHDETKPSLSISFEKGLFFCFSCGKSGKIEELFGDDYKKIPDIVELSKNKILSLLSDKLIKEKENWEDVNIPFRNIQIETYKYFNVKQRDNTFRFPLIKYGKLIGYYFYDIKFGEKKIKLLGSERVYPQYEQNIKYGDYLIVVEGIFDMLRTWEIGYKQVIALVVSSAYRNLQDIIREYNVSKLYIMLDSDQAGKRIANNIKTMFNNSEIICLPEGQDPASCKELKQILDSQIGGQK